MNRHTKSDEQIETAATAGACMEHSPIFYPPAGETAPMMQQDKSGCQRNIPEDATETNKPWFNSDEIPCGYGRGTYVFTANICSGVVCLSKHIGEFCFSSEWFCDGVMHN